MGSDGTIRFGQVAEPRVSVVIVGWRSAPHLLDCLTALKSLQHSVSFEVIVSLNEPTSSLSSVLERRVEGIRVVTSLVNEGFAGACNRGAAEARGDFIVLLNDDAVVRKGWLEALVEAADQDDQAGAVGSRILLDDDTVQEEGAVIWSDGEICQIGHRSPIDSRPDPRLRRVDYCSAASLLVRRDTWETVGGMDEGYYPAYYEDVDLCLKIQSRGQKILYQPGSTMVHRAGASTTHPFQMFLGQRNRRRLAARWAPALALHEPPHKESPEAIAHAARSGQSRPLPIPAPLLDADVPSSPQKRTDEDFLRMEREILVAYIAALEEGQFLGEAERDSFVTKIASLEQEIHRLHHAAADLQESERFLQNQVRSALGQVEDARSELEAARSEFEGARAEFTGARAELELALSRRRYQMVDRLYEVARSIPGFPRALQWVTDRRHGTTPSPPPP